MTATVAPRSTATAIASPIASSTPYPQPTPWPEPTPIIETRYIRCVVVGVSAVLSAAEQQTEAAKQGVLLCP
jgi:hypothetical protein